MAHRSNGAGINLSGHWNLSGVVLQIASLPTLDKVESGLGKFFNIDCSEIRSIDMSGLQLLYVWMQCARLRGMKAMLINLPEIMLQALKRPGLEKCFSDFCADVA
jgi:ABC-type transporter Mla MlaB component